MMQWLPQRLLFALFMIVVATSAAQSASRVSQHWVATWAISQDLAPTTPDHPVLPPETKMPDFSGRGPRQPRPLPTVADNQTVRMIVHSKIGGDKIRVELSNAFGKSAVTIGNAHIALRTKGSSIDSSTDRQLTFSGSKTFNLRPGALTVSDPVNLDIKPMSDLAILLYVVDREAPPSNHMLGLHTTYISDGDTTASESMPDAITNTSYLWLRSVDVDAPGTSFAIACLGDSITDGFKTTIDLDQDWPSLLAKRLNDKKSGPRISVINEGISGNQVLRDGAGVSALARFDRDVVAEPGGAGSRRGSRETIVVPVPCALAALLKLLISNCPATNWPTVRGTTTMSLTMSPNATTRSRTAPLAFCRGVTRSTEERTRRWRCRPPPGRCCGRDRD